MEQLLQFFILLPFVGYVVSLFIPDKKEKFIASIASTIVGVHFLALLVFVGFWIINRSPVLDIRHLTFYKEDSIEIFINFYFDKITAVFALVGASITFLVAVYSRFYLHRDSGFKRFFNTLLLFYFAYTLVIFSGNFETLFVGWEFLGITSFLLIVFYRDRYLPVKNGLKTISLYRLGDVCLILSLWMSHHLWHENITFNKLNDLQLVATHINEHNYFTIFIIVMFVIAATIKSAQIPFSSWLPRAMEGPTTSSAIFYGSLSVHLSLLANTNKYESVGHFYWFFNCDNSFTNCPSSIFGENADCIWLNCANRSHVYRSCHGLACISFGPFYRQCFFENLSVISITFSFRIFNT